GEACNAVSCHDSALCCLSFLTRRRRPRSTLFPYTTLFRSQEHSPGPQERRRNLENGPGRQGRADAPPRLENRREEPGKNLRLGQDRKSTRLNSSHDQISYAVFCLKKKIDTSNSCATFRCRA